MDDEGLCTYGLPISLPFPISLSLPTTPVMLALPVKEDEEDEELLLFPWLNGKRDEVKEEFSKLEVLTPSDEARSPQAAAALAKPPPLSTIMPLTTTLPSLLFSSKTFCNNRLPPPLLPPP
jgi:hypothetical protein